jgi:hypothetical protein
VTPEARVVTPMTIEITHPVKRFGENARKRCFRCGEQATHAIWLVDGASMSDDTFNANVLAFGLTCETHL